MRISDWSSDVCSSDLPADRRVERALGVFDDDLVRGDVELRRRVAQLSVELVAKLKIMNFLVLEEIGGIAGQGVDKGCDRSIKISRAEARLEEGRVGEGCGSSVRSRLWPDA